MNKSERLKASVHEGGVDLISNLIDPILHLILSGLPSTEEIIRTSILARRWRYLWTSLPSLDLELYRAETRSEEEKSKFKNIVNRALSHRSVGLDSFRLSCWDYYFSTSTLELEQWIHATVMRNVKQLDLDFRPREDMVMPHCLVTCASLEVLRLSLCLTRLLILPSFSGFPALRVLKLKYIKFIDDDFVKYILNCPLLEDLTLEDCGLDKLDIFCISSPKLKKLSFEYWENDELCGCLKLCCPNLVFLEILGEVASNYIFEDLYSLKEAVIDPERNDIPQQINSISGSVQKISHVESLTTGLCVLYECINADLALPNLRTLALTTVNADYTEKAFNQILKICPKLESLCLTVQNVDIYEGLEELEEYDDWKLDIAGTRNLTPDVAWVEFFKFNGEMPKLTIDWYYNTPHWNHFHAQWGNEANFSHWIHWREKQ